MSERLLVRNGCSVLLFNGKIKYIKLSHTEIVPLDQTNICLKGARDVDRVRKKRGNYHVIFIGKLPWKAPPSCDMPGAHVKHGNARLNRFAVSHILLYIYY